MWDCETKVGITCLIVICGSANTIGLAASILQWEEMVVSLSYGTAFFSINIAVAMLLFCVLVTDNQKGMALTTHLLKTRFIFLLIFLGLFNAEVRGMVGFKFERDILVSFPPSTEAPATSARVIADPDLSLIAEVRQKKSHTWNATIMHQKPGGQAPDEDVVMYVSCGVFICNVIIDAFVIRRLGIYVEKMGAVLPATTNQATQ
ncbi:uncharacterized protein LOC144169535 [Haemaphysalis longicornis]